MILKKNDIKGFTLVELMLAMTVFSTVMVIATVGFIGMSRTFNRGLIRKDLSEYSQSATEDITRTIRGLGTNANFTNCNAGEPACPGSGDYSAICFGTFRYAWGVNSGKKGLYKDAPSSCNEELSADAKAIVSDRYVVRSLSIAEIPSGGPAMPVSLFAISGVLTTSDDDAIVLPPEVAENEIRCRGTAEAATVRTCSVEKFNFTVNARGQ